MKLTGTSAFVLIMAVATAHAQTDYRPKPLHLEAPIKTWDEGLPMGNGLMGGLLWGGTGKINISLDRGDLWDLRVAPGTRTKEWTYQNMQRLVKEKNQSELVRLFDAPYDNIAYPTKIPAGRIEIDTGVNQVTSFHLDLARGVAEAVCQDGGLKALVSAKRPVLVFQYVSNGARINLIRPESVTQLGYKLAPVQKDGDDTYFLQEGALGFKYAIYVGREKSMWAVAIVTSEESQDPIAEAKKRVKEALKAGFDKIAAENLNWWTKFWSISSVRIPSEKAQQHYDFVKYLYGAGSRPGAPPIALQGVWTADAGTLPPWKGDYHNDLNTQMTYIAYQTAGLFEEGRSFLDFNWKLLPEYRKFSQSFFGVKGASVPGVMTLKGEPMGGWGMYSLSPTNGAWVAQLFYRHWRYTQDSKFLRQRAYPWCSEIGETLRGILKPGPDGFLKLPLSSSPEIHDNSLSAWLEPNSNYDQMLMADLFESLADMAKSLGKTEDAAKWSGLRSKLSPYLVDLKTGSLMFAKGLPYQESHRHFSHAMAVYPLGRVEGKTAIDTIKLLDKTGTAWWCGYSFSWMSAMCARNGEIDLAARYLDDYLDAFILRNGFHANGDQKKRGLSNFTYRPVTLEGNFQAMEAIHEMLLQSNGGVIKFFPAIRASWKEASIDGLWTEGGFKVWGTRTNGETKNVRVQANVDSEFVMVDPFGGKGTWSKPPAFGVGGLLRFKLLKGESLTGKRS